MFVIPPYRWLIAAIVAGVVKAHAIDQQADLQHSNAPVSAESLEALTPPPVLLHERFSTAFNRRADELFADELHPFNAMKWSVQSADVDPNDFGDRTSRAAERAFSRSVEYGLRDALVDTRIMYWIEERQEFIADLLRDSIDSVEEESVDPLGGSYGLVEQSWWKDLSRRRNIRYGVRPFRTSPYTYLSFGVRDNESIFLLGHVRYYYDHFSDHRFELALSVPLSYGFSVGLGTSYQFGQHDQQQRAGIKLFKEFKRDGILHVGFEMRERPTLLAGVSFLW